MTQGGSCRRPSGAALRGGTWMREAEDGPGLRGELGEKPTVVAMQNATRVQLS